VALEDVLSAGAPFEGSPVRQLARGSWPASRVGANSGGFTTAGTTRRAVSAPQLGLETLISGLHGREQGAWGAQPPSRKRFFAFLRLKCVFSSP
jgi:hypothetical protein